jgi:hypothetical protein
MILTKSEPNTGDTWTFLVANEIVDVCESWSAPVRFRFEKLADGTVQMWVQTI